MMSDPAHDDDKPLDPQVERVRRRMVRLLMISIGIMVVGLMAVFGSIVYKINQADDDGAENPPAATATGAMLKDARIPLPAGARVTASSLNDNRLVLTLELASGRQQIVVFDTAEARIVATYDFAN